MRKQIFSLMIAISALVAFAAVQAKFSFGFAVEKPKSGVSFGFGLNRPRATSVCQTDSSCSSCCTGDFCPNCPECVAQVDREYQATRRYKQMQELEELRARRSSLKRKIDSYEKKLERLEYDYDCVCRKIKNIERAL